MNMKARRRGQGGWAIATFMVVVSVMLMIGLATLAIVDTQSHASGVERSRVSAFTLAEGALNAQAFMLSRAWPDSSAAAFATSCTEASTAGTVGCPDQTWMARSFTGGDYSGANWQTDVRDNGGVYGTVWTDAALAAQPGWDQNADGLLWVRARAVLAGRTRTLVARVQVNRSPAFPQGYATIAGRFSTDLGVALNQVVASPLLTGIIGNHQLISGGKLGLRCGLLSGCVTGAFSVLTEVGLGSLLANDILQYGMTAAVSDDVIAQMRQRALAAGTYYSSIASGAACPAPPAGSTTAVIFVEQVGNGDQTCTVTLSGGATTQVRALIVNNGRVTFTGTGTYMGVVYAVNAQRASLGDTSREVVRIESNAKVRGMVAVDGAGGALGIYTPPLNVYSLINTLPVCQGLLAILCGPLKLTLQGLGVDALLTQLITLVGLNAVVNGLLGQLSTYGPAILYDGAVASALLANGTVGTIANSFREIP
jgi:hypothetical protein